MIYMFMSMSFILSMSFLFMKHPLSMGLILLLQTILMSFISGLMSMNFWFSYILLLIYLGGMLVLFMYVTSLASNEMFFYSNKILFLLSFIPIILILIFILNKIHFTTNFYENMENSINFNFNMNNFLLKMYNKPINNMTIIMASYLFLTLIAIVKIINIYKGPLRKFN